MRTVCKLFVLVVRELLLLPLDLKWVEWIDHFFRDNLLALLHQFALVLKDILLWMWEDRLDSAVVAHVSVVSEVLDQWGKFWFGISPYLLVDLLPLWLVYFRLFRSLCLFSLFRSELMRPGLWVSCLDVAMNCLWETTSWMVPCHLLLVTTCTPIREFLFFIIWSLIAVWCLSSKRWVRLNFFVIIARRQALCLLLSLKPLFCGCEFNSFLGFSRYFWSKSASFC